MLSIDESGTFCANEFAEAKIEATKYMFKKKSLKKRRTLVKIFSCIPPKEITTLRNNYAKELCREVSYDVNRSFLYGPNTEADKYGVQFFIDADCNILLQDCKAVITQTIMKSLSKACITRRKLMSKQ